MPMGWGTYTQPAKGREGQGLKGRTLGGARAPPRRMKRIQIHKLCQSSPQKTLDGTNEKKLKAKVMRGRH